MYIRRKVFSLLQDENGEERYFSTTDITLEDAEERIFSINEEEQREFGEIKRANKAKKKALETKRGDNLKSLDKTLGNGTSTKLSKMDIEFRKMDLPGDKAKATEDEISRRMHRSATKNIEDKLAKKQGEDPKVYYDSLKKDPKTMAKLRMDQLKRGKVTVDELTKKINKESGLDDLANNIKRVDEILNKKATELSSTTPKPEVKISPKKSLKIGKKGKVALGTAAAIGAAYGAKKLYDKSKKKKEN